MGKKSEEEYIVGSSADECSSSSESLASDEEGGQSFELCRQLSNTVLLPPRKRRKAKSGYNCFWKWYMANRANSGNYGKKRCTGDVAVEVGKAWMELGDAGQNKFKTEALKFNGTGKKPRKNCSRGKGISKKDQGPFYSRCCPQQVIRLVKGLGSSSPVHAMITEMGFQEFVGMCCGNMPKKFIILLLGHFDFYKGELVVGGERKRISANDVAELMGIPNGPNPVESDKEGGKLMEKKLRQLIAAQGEDKKEEEKREGMTEKVSSKYVERRVNFEGLKKILCLSGVDDVILKQAFLLLALGAVLCPTSSQYPSPKLHSVVVDVTDVKRHRWGEFVLAWLCDEIKIFRQGERKRAKESGKHSVGGCLLLLMVFYFERFPLTNFEQRPGNEHPLKFWNKSRVRRRVKMELEYANFNRSEGIWQQLRPDPNPVNFEGPSAVTSCNEGEFGKIACALMVKYMKAYTRELQMKIGGATKHQRNHARVIGREQGIFCGKKRRKGDEANTDAKSVREERSEIKSGNIDPKLSVGADGKLKDYGEGQMDINLNGVDEEMDGGVGSESNVGKQFMDELEKGKECHCDIKYKGDREEDEEANDKESGEKKRRHVEECSVGDNCDDELNYGRSGYVEKGLEGNCVIVSGIESEEIKYKELVNDSGTRKATSKSQLVPTTTEPCQSQSCGSSGSEKSPSDPVRPMTRAWSLKQHIKLEIKQPREKVKGVRGRELDEQMGLNKHTTTTDTANCTQKVIGLVREFTKKEIWLYTWATRMRPTRFSDNPMVVSFGKGIVLYLKDLRCLGPRQWVSNIVIHFHSLLLNHRQQISGIVQRHYLSPQFAMSIVQDAGGDAEANIPMRQWEGSAYPREFREDYLGYSILKCELVFIPILFKQHWFLWIVNLRDRRLQVLDPQSSARASERALLEEHVVSVMSQVFSVIGEKQYCLTNFKREDIIVPQQENGHDCGVMVMKFMEMWDGMEMSHFDPKTHVARFRQDYIISWINDPANEVRAATRQLAGLKTDP